MTINKGVLNCNRTATGDEVSTPYYAVEPIMRYIPKDKTIWCPFDTDRSAFYRLLKENGYQVIKSSLIDGENFFTYQPPTNWDLIVSNPPFSKKDAVIKRLYELGKPFAILLPLSALQGIYRYQYFKQGIQLLAFNRRIQYQNNLNAYSAQNCAFASAYFCRDLLPRSLILEELHIYEREL